MEKIQLSDLVRGKDLYKRRNTVEVFTASHRITNKVYCVKRIFTESIADANNKHQEIISMLSFSHPNILDLVGCSLGGEGQTIDSVIIIMEYFPEGDLESLIQKRMKLNQYWTESELFRYIIQIIDALFYMKMTKGVSHRDIKPQNIFLYNNCSQLKLGDLGAATKISRDDLTIAGTPLYLSPLLRLGYLSMMTTGENRTIHDPYKSDIFSLGLVLLFMTSLKKLERLSNLNTLSEDLKKRIGEIPNSYARVKSLLALMLAVDEKQRIGIEEAKQYVEKFISGVFDKCGRCECEINSINKKNFNGSLFCPDCYEFVSNLKVHCLLCEQEHSQSNLYKFDHNYYCKRCLTIDTFNEQRLWCRVCSSLLDASLECDCQTLKCHICKSPQHEGSCNKNLGEYNVRFECNCHTLIEKYPDSKYFYCFDEKVYYCMVCCKEALQVHQACEVLLENGHLIN